MSVIRTPKNHCLNCGHIIDAVEPADGSGDAAGPNDLTQCLKCGAVMALDDELRLRPLTPEEIAEVRGDAGLVAELMRRTKMILWLQASRG